MTLPNADIDPSGLLEYSVVFTDRSLNHMSARFIDTMQQSLEILRDTYRAHSVAMVPGGGSYAMEAVARQLVTGRRCLIVRNGLFSYRWSQILELGRITDDITVCAARPVAETVTSAWQPAPIEEVVAKIRSTRPEVVCAPHVETAAGMILPDDYIRSLAAATHEVGGLLVIDGIASGAIWIDMIELGVDVLLSAPQKGWSGSPGTGFVMLSEAARDAVRSSTTTSFAVDLGKWLSICDGYVEGKAGYHATMPTDTIVHNLQLMRETCERGLDLLRTRQNELGTRVRSLLADYGLPAVAEGVFAAPGVVVVHSHDPGLHTGTKFAEAGLQIAAGVPLHCGEPDSFSTFRLGLFGLDKLADVDGTVDRLTLALDRIRG